MLPGIDLELSVFDIPGHTAGHIAYYSKGTAPLVLCGDTLFAAGCGRLFEGTPSQMWTSLSKLAALAQTLQMSGEGTTVALSFTLPAEILQMAMPKPAVQPAIQ